jgi:hypothetical protein
VQADKGLVLHNLMQPESHEIRRCSWVGGEGREGGRGFVGIGVGDRALGKFCALFDGEAVCSRSPTRSRSPARSGSARALGACVRDSRGQPFTYVPYLPAHPRFKSPTDYAPYLPGTPVARSLSLPLETAYTKTPML